MKEINGIHVLTGQEYTQMWNQIATWQTENQTTRDPNYVDLRVTNTDKNEQETLHILQVQFLDMKTRMLNYIKDHNNQPATEIGVEGAVPVLGVYKNPRYIPNDKQQTSYYCADDMLQECFFELYAETVPQNWIAQKAGTTTEGTDHRGVTSAVQAFDTQYNHSTNATFENFSSTGWQLVAQMVADPKTFLGMHILYRDHVGWGHYITIIEVDTINKTVTFVDTLNVGIPSMTVSFATMELWIRDTPNNQPSLFIAKKIS